MGDTVTMNFTPKVTLGRTGLEVGRLGISSSFGAPPDVPPPSAADCYRFVLSNPAVDVCMMGAKTIDQMRENLKTLVSGPMTAEELERMRMIGNHIYGKP